jgi:hypothetical protein
LTSSSPSRAEDSFRKTAMSRREDIVSCIDVTIMDKNPSHNTLANIEKYGHARLRVPLSLAGLKAGISRGEIR